MTFVDSNLWGWTMLARMLEFDELEFDLGCIAKYLDGTVVGYDTITFPGPGHSGKDRSASVRFTPEAWNGVFLSHSFSDPDERDEIERMMWEALDACGWEGEALARPRVGEENESVRKRQSAARMWKEGGPIAGTPVEAYLRGRGLALPATEALRYCRNGPFGPGQTVPLMLAAVTDIRSGAFLALHRTALTLDGQKAYHSISGHAECRATIGSSKGGAIRLYAPGPRLGVGEGIETALSLRALEGFGDLPVWSLLNDGGLANLPVLEGVRTLVVAEDADAGGIMAASRVAERWRAAGRSVCVLGTRHRRTSQHLNDINDLVRSTQHGTQKIGRGIER